MSKTTKSDIKKLHGAYKWVWEGICEFLHDTFDHDPDRFLDRLSSIKMLVKNFSLSAKALGVEFNSKMISFLK